MSNQTVTAGRRAKGKRAALRTWGIYLLVLLSWAVLVVLLAYLGRMVCSAIHWNAGWVYGILHLVERSLPLVMLLVILAGWMVISYFFIARPVQNMELMLAGAEELAHPTQTPIRLPDTLKHAEDQLNLVREQALRAAQEARDAEQRKNDLVVYLAHDLKTPLTSVIGYLTLLRDEPQISPEMRAHYTGVALDKAQRLEDLVSEFFDITRFSLSHLELEKRDTDLKRMLEQICSEFEPILQQHQMRCTRILPDELRAVCDPDKMARVFDNLLNNACHYAYPASTLYIEGRVKSEQVFLTFCNAGPTIPPEKLKRMFEKFFRLDASRGTQTGNAGLGLAIAKEIVEAHGGRIHAQSSAEKVIFTVILPVHSDW